jgi:hypothetical protein
MELSKQHYLGIVAGHVHGSSSEEELRVTWEEVPNLTVEKVVYAVGLDLTSDSEAKLIVSCCESAFE